MRVLLIDSYDSFAINLAQAFLSLGARVDVVQSDRITPTGALELAPDRIVLGPGPGRPEEAGCLVPLVSAVAGRIPLLGVCLGHQAIGLAFGGGIRRHEPVHGLATPVHHHGTGLFEGLPHPCPMTRYHSLVVDPVPLPVTAWSDDGAVMGISHPTLPVHGIQFHPESILSGAPGMRLLQNFLDLGDAVGATPQSVRPLPEPGCGARGAA